MKRFGFTMVELVFIIVILGILAAVAVPRMIMSRDDACYAKMRSNLAEAQSDISREYTKRFMQGKSLPTTDSKFLEILKDTLGADASNKCGFTITSATNITMTVGKNSLKLTTSQDSITKSPVISCVNNSDEMCKKLMNKK